MKADVFGQRPFLMLGVLAVVAACGSEDPLITDEPEAAARVLALSNYSAPVGTLIEIYGTDFPTPDKGRAELVFEGVFEAADGTRESVEMVEPVRRVDASTLRWDRFGPYANPFSRSGNKVGHFIGTVNVRVTDPMGEAIEGQAPLTVDFNVGESLIVREFQPVSASCNAGVLRVLGGASYRLAVESLGFEPETYEYIFSAPSLRLPATRIRVRADGRFGAIGEKGEFRVPEVPQGLNAYGAIVTVQARTDDGRLVQNSFGVSVHRPLEVFYNGNVQVAEVMAPTPVSGCIPGGFNGRDVQYSESQAETLSKNYAVSWNESWLQSHTVQQGSSQTVGLSERNGVGFSTTNGQSFNWSLGSEVNGGVSLLDLVELGVKANAQRGGATNQAATNSATRETGINASSTTTETESVSASNSQSQSESFAWSVSSSEVISRGFGGFVIPNTFGTFYRQTTRLVRRAAMVAYNQCGAAQVVGEVDFTDWTWSPDLALADQCPPLPPSNLPSAQCNVPPCAGQ